MLQQKTYQAQHFGPHWHNPQGKDAPKWYIVDAKNQVVGRLASLIAKVLIGKHKPTFTRHTDTGDFVIVLNAGQVVFTGDKWNKKLYRNHSGYVGGLKTTAAKDMLERHPEEILKQAVWGMTNKSNLARHQVSKMKLYLGSDHPHQAQNPQPLPRAAVRKSTLSR